MPRFNLESAVVLTVAITSSLTAAWWLNHLDGRGEVQAAVMSSAAPPAAV